MRFLRRLGLLPDRRHSARTPVYVGAKLELDVIDLHGTARDLGDGGVFFATSAPIAPGVRGTLHREPGGEPINVRVTWRRGDAPDQPAGLGLAFDQSYILIRKTA
jgi:hypothetical protein